ncbi:MAG: hypothetical protein SFU84_15025 [Gemmatimonadales bacterium]|nr:hypothetical protein [Gemmatimonadales bacterium]
MMIAGCDDAVTMPCSDIAKFGVNVEVIDAVSRQRIPEGVRGAVIEGDHVDSLRVFRDLEGRISSLAGAVERPGTYRVELVATGYQPWTRSDVRVAQGACHVEPVSIQAEMVPGE